MARKINWAVMGTADIARGATIPAMLQAENCALYAVASRNLDKARRFQAMFGFEKAYGSYEELLADPDVEAVYIPLPNDMHCEWAIRALNAKKHVLCEKPLAVSEEQALKMFQAAEDSDVFLMEAFAYLHSPFVHAVKAELDRGVIGDVRFMETSFLTGRRPDTDIRMKRENYGGSLYDLGCYPVSMTLWLMGREPETVRGAALYSERNIDLCTSALLQFENGAVAHIDCGMVMPRGLICRFQIYGSLGSITASVAYNQPGDLAYTITLPEGTETKTVNARNNYFLEVEQLGRCILNGESPLVSREFSLLNARVMDRIIKDMGY